MNDLSDYTGVKLPELKPREVVLDGHLPEGITPFRVIDYLTKCGYVQTTHWFDEDGTCHIRAHWRPISQFFDYATLE